MLRHDTHPAQCNQLPIMPYNVSMLFVFVNVGGKIDKCQPGGYQASEQTQTAS